MGLFKKQKARTPYENSMIKSGMGDFLLDEAFNSLIINLQYLIKNKESNVIIVTSASPNEGKTMVSYNVGLTLARQGKKVLAIDADLRKSRLHKYFGVPREDGLSDILCDIKKPKEVIKHSDIEGYDFITSGASTLNPMKLFGSDGLENSFNELKEGYDWVVIDTPPMYLVADTMLLVPISDGVLFVADESKTKHPELSRSINTLRIAKANILGIVLNNAEEARVQKSSGGKYYRYDYYSKDNEID